MRITYHTITIHVIRTAFASNIIAPFSRVLHIHVALVEHNRERLDAIGEPHVTADDRIVAHGGLAAQNGGAGVDGHIVLDGGVALDAGLCLIDAQRAQRNALINLHIVADDGRLAHNNARAVVDAERVADLRARVNVDARFAVGVLGEKARQNGDVLLEKLVRQPIHYNGVEARVRDNHFLNRFGRGVTVENGRSVLNHTQIEQLKRVREGLNLVVNLLVGKRQLFQRLMHKVAHIVVARLGRLVVVAKDWKQQVDGLCQQLMAQRLRRNLALGAFLELPYVVEK